MNREKLKRWLEKVFYDEREEGPCVKLALRHMTSGQSTKGGEVFSIRIPHNDDHVQVGDDELLHLINDIEGAALDDAEGIGAGVQRYKLLAFFKHEPRPLTRFSFRMSATEFDGEEDEIGMSEAPDQKGLTAQLMRHNEALMRTAVMGANQTIGLLTRTVRSQGEQIENLLSERRETFSLVEDLKSKKHERELMTLEAENQQKRHQDLFEKASLLLPTVVNRIAGKKLLPEANTALIMIKELAESLSPDQLPGLMKSLRPEQQILLMDLMKATQEEDGEEKN